MKKLLVLLIALIAIPAFSQSYVDAPRTMNHTRTTTTTAFTVDLWLNEGLDDDGKKYFTGFVDYQCILDDSSEVAGANMGVKLVPLKRVQRADIDGDVLWNNIGWTTQTIADTVDLGTFSADTTSIYSVPLDTVFTQLPICDGFRAICTPSTAATTLNFWQSVRSIFKK